MTFKIEARSGGSGQVLHWCVGLYGVPMWESFLIICQGSLGIWNAFLMGICNWHVDACFETRIQLSIEEKIKQLRWYWQALRLRWCQWWSMSWHAEGWLDAAWYFNELGLPSSSDLFGLLPILWRQSGREWFQVCRLVELLVFWAIACTDTFNSVTSKYNIWKMGCMWLKTGERERLTQTSIQREGEFDGHGPRAAVFRYPLCLATGHPLGYVLHLGQLASRSYQALSWTYQYSSSWNTSDDIFSQIFWKHLNQYCGFCGWMGCHSQRVTCLNYPDLPSLEIDPQAIRSSE